MRILITGASGFLGGHIVAQALEAAHELVAIRRPGGKPQASLSPDISWVEASLDSVPSSAFEGVDALIHLAAAGVSPQPLDWSNAMEVNVRQSMELLLAAESAGVPRILLCGSCFEYGAAAAAYDKIPVDAPLMPSGPYATSKAAFSMAAAGFARNSASSLVLLRPFHFFGIGQHASNFWPSLKLAAESGQDFPMTPGAQIRDFQPVEETAAAFLGALSDWPGVAGEMKTYHLGTGIPVTLLDFATTWWKRWNAQGRLLAGAIPYRKGEVMRFVPELDRRFS
ncbi:MAG: NAD(P)-dependent oxidoreductase [Akkermansiaceae bacterium]|nr:NAD(P)-dependent oxidoreductase [Akkermansiaceae bacterium]